MANELDAVRARVAMEMLFIMIDSLSKFLACCSWESGGPKDFGLRHVDSKHEKNIFFSDDISPIFDAAFLRALQVPFRHVSSKPGAHPDRTILNGGGFQA